MFEQIILGIIQGVAEWLPVSSEGMIVLIKSNFFPSTTPLAEVIIKQALFLHLGTFFAALVYFRREVGELLKALFNYRKASAETQKLFGFLFISTMISGCLGILLLKGLTEFVGQFESSTRTINFLIGLLLIVTAYLELKAHTPGHRLTKDLKTSDAVILGIVQGFAVLPGLSRSGLTVSALLLRKFEKIDSLRLSFLMSLPIVLAGNIILNINSFHCELYAFIGLLCAFIFGLLTIHLLLKLAEKINFGYFILVFAFLMIISCFVPVNTP